MRSLCGAVCLSSLSIAFQSPARAGNWDSFIQDLGKKVYEDAKDAIQEHGQSGDDQDHGTGSASQPAGSAGQARSQQPLQTADAPRFDRAWITEIQSKLAALGYDPGPIDGAFGNATSRALGSFQRDRGLVSDGQPKPSVMRVLRSAGIAPATQTVQQAPDTTQPHPSTATDGAKSLTRVQRSALRNAKNLAEIKLSSAHAHKAGLMGTCGLHGKLSEEERLESFLSENLPAAIPAAGSKYETYYRQSLSSVSQLYQDLCGSQDFTNELHRAESAIQGSQREILAYLSQAGSPASGGLPAAESTQASQQAASEADTGTAEPSEGDTPRYDPHWLSELQTRLSKQGYDPGPATGTFGKPTADAIASFQRDQGLAVTGLPAPSVMDRLRSKAPTRAQQQAESATGKTSAAVTSHRIRKLTAEEVDPYSKLLPYSRAWGSQLGHHAHFIYGCTGIQEPIRENYNTLLMVGFPEDTEKQDTALRGYDHAYEANKSRFKERDCTPEKLDTAYRGYTALMTRVLRPRKATATDTQGTTSTEIETAAHEIQVDCLQSSGHRKGVLDCACVKQNAIDTLSNGVSYQKARVSASEGCFSYEVAVEEKYQQCVIDLQPGGDFANALKDPEIPPVCECVRGKLQMSNEGKAVRSEYGLPLVMECYWESKG